MNKGKLVVQLGKIQEIFENGGSYSGKSCEMIDTVIACDKKSLSEYGGSGRIRCLDGDGNRLIQLSVVKSISSMSDESKTIALIVNKGDNVKFTVYYGKDSYVDFNMENEEYSMTRVEDRVNTLKNFYNSIDMVKGELSTVIFIVDDKDVLDAMLKDTFFDKCFVLLTD